MVKRIRASVGLFRNMPVDFIRTVVPSPNSMARADRSVELLRAFLMNPPTRNARFLSQKAVIGLLPEELFGAVIWEGAGVA